MDDELPSFEELNVISGAESVAENRAPYDEGDRTTPGFKKLRVYQASVDLAEEVYNLTACFPKEELFGITRQVREAAVSAPLNIAEGWGRNGKAEFARHCDIARGSLHEVDAAFDVAVRLRFVERAVLSALYVHLNNTSGMLLKLSSALRKK